VSQLSLHAERNGQYPPISDYAIIGDSRTAALVARDGSIDWYCWPAFDHPAVFCRILDARRGGYFQICPTGAFAATRSYLEGTNVLATTFRAAGGTIRVTDLMPVDRPNIDAAPTIVRVVEGVAGSVEVELRFRPTFGYARTPTTVTPEPGGARARSEDGTHGWLASPVPLEPGADNSARGTTRVSAGQRLIFTFECGKEDRRDLRVSDDIDSAIDATVRHWRTWAARCEYQGPYRDLVLRSALVLKLLSFDPSGAVVAAPTTSLPEVIGGVRNWDYRYSWLRDSALILEALDLVGYGEEAGRFFDWLRRVWLANRDDLRIMYRADGGSIPPERDLDFLAGYMDSRPVRTGNAAANQVQLDVYGEIMEAAHYVYANQHPPSPEIWDVLRSCADRAARDWRELDRGIWEVRGAPHSFLYSRVLCWTALQRAIDLVHQYHLHADVDYWERERDEVKREVLEKGYNPRLKAFTQYAGSDELDASALVIPIVGFLSPTDPRVVSTVEAIRKHLTWDGFLRRYAAPDGVPGHDSPFVLCTFWMVDDLAMAGHTDEATQEFERAISYANDVGLLSEEIDPVHRRLLGNFPQGFSHLGIIRSAYYIANAERLGAQRGPTNRRQRVSTIKQAGGGNTPDWAHSAHSPEAPAHPPGRPDGRPELPGRG
jgi:GH15 family glucan-1,4-alpha-glucosidase